MAIALLDVHYAEDQATAACVVAGSWTDESSVEQHVRTVHSMAPYEPGAFWKRELPALLAVLDCITRTDVDTLVIDGDVWLGSASRPGLGARLCEVSGKPVVGIAKTAFLGVEGSDVVLPVLRGASRRPLFVSSEGVGLRWAADAVRSMAGPHRIPLLVAAVDRLSRSGDSTISLSEP